MLIRWPSTVARHTLPNMNPPKNPPLAIAPEASPKPEAVQAIEAGLTAHAEKLGLKGDWAPKWILARDPSGAVQGGVRYLIVFDWLFVHWLWVAEAYRGGGVGSKLMEQAEAAAREQGCRGVYLDTFTFQAPRFYERRGYREFGRLENFPSGQSRIWFAKRL